MSINWTFYSFSKPRWDAIFGGGLEGAEEHVIQSVTWDPGIWHDEQAAIEIARTITRKGISYEGLSTDEAHWLDEIIVGFFCQEGLEELLAFEYESPEGLNMVVVDELLARSRHLDQASWLGRLLGRSKAPASALLPLLVTGRRYGGEDRPRKGGVYVILSPDEIARLHGEIERNLSQIRPWPNPAYEVTARECLLDVLARAREKQRWLAGRFC